MTKEILKIAIVILTYNAKKLVLSCLTSLEQINKKNIKSVTIVVDNGSKDGTVESILKKYPDVVVIENRVNYGFAKGINYGLRFAYQQRVQYILLLNDDTILASDFLIKLLLEASKNSFYICGPKIKTIDNKIWSQGGKIDKVRFSGGLIDYGREDSNLTTNQQVDFVSGTAMLVHRKVFERVGFLDEDYFLYYDDVDFCYRAKKMGFNSYIVSSTEITHLETATIRKNSPSHYYHAAKSHLIFVFKRAPFVIKIRELIRLGKTIFELTLEKNKIKKKYELLAIADFLLWRLGQITSIKPR